MKTKFVILSLFCLLTFVVFAADSWKTKPEESYVTFSTRSAVGRVHGKITGLQAEIKFSENDLEHSSFSASLDPATLDTDNNKRDNHLRSEDFLNVPLYPSIKFVSKKIYKTAAGYDVTGDLTIKDVTKEFTFPFTFENQGSKGTFKGAFSINRRDFNVGGKTKLAGEKINIEVVTVVEK